MLHFATTFATSIITKPFLFPQIRTQGKEVSGCKKRHSPVDNKQVMHGLQKWRFHKCLLNVCKFCDTCVWVLSVRHLRLPVASVTNVLTFCIHTSSTRCTGVTLAVKPCSTLICQHVFYIALEKQNYFFPCNFHKSWYSPYTVLQQFWCITFLTYYFLLISFNKHLMTSVTTSLTN